MENQVLAKGTIDEKCYFLNMIPLEIRRKIYEYLIAPVDKIHMSGRFLFKGHGVPPDFPPKLRLEPSILRANQQIHDEATSLFFSKVTLIMGIEDIDGLQLAPEMFEEEYFARSSVPLREPTNAFLLMSQWRCSPFQGAVDTNIEKKQCKYQHERPMEPQVFARFQKIVFEMSLMGLKSFFNNEFNLSSNASYPMRDKVRVTRVFEVLRRVLSLIPRVQFLEVVVATEIQPMSILRGVTSREDLDDATQEYLERGDHFPSQDMIESQEVLRPLTKLTNVDEFSLKVLPYKQTLPGFQYSMADLSNHEVMITKYQQYLAKIPLSRLVDKLEALKGSHSEFSGHHRDAAEALQDETLSPERREFVKKELEDSKEAMKDLEPAIAEVEEELRQMDG